MTIIDYLKQYEGFYLVNTDGFSVTYGTFFNPTTKERFTKRIWDNDDWRVENEPEVQALRMLPRPDETVMKAYYHFIGKIQVGDLVEVYKGRKIPKGYRGVVVKIWDWRDQYGRSQTTYVNFQDGQKTSISNCRLVEE